MRYSIWDDPDLSPKIRDACKVAREAGYEYLWIDSCCIDKTSSSELSEAINSMYLWYGQANACYAYLADVPSAEDPRATDSSFRKSRWFTRGWTLQELIAPRSLTFLSAEWEVIGSKFALDDLIEEITGIPDAALLHRKTLDNFSVAQRLSWASARETTRIEDRAYSLLGIFDISMPTLYGEGERAFRRLQEEILLRVPDQSLFAWKDVCMDIEMEMAQGEVAEWKSLRQGAEITCRIPKIPDRSPFAPSVGKFQGGGNIRAVAHHDVSDRLQLSDFPPALYTITPQGIQTRLPVLPLSQCLPQHCVHYPESILSAQWYLAILGCEHNKDRGHLLGRICYTIPTEYGIDRWYNGYIEIEHETEGFVLVADLFPLSPATIERCRGAIELKRMYIPHPERAIVESEDLRFQSHETIHLKLLEETRDVLRSQGFEVALEDPDEDHPTTHRLTLSRQGHAFTIEYNHVLSNADEGQALTMEARFPDSLSEPHSLFWSDGPTWNESLPTQEVAIQFTSRQLKVGLGLDLAAPSYYFLCVEVIV